MRDLARDGRGGLPLALRLLVIRPPDDGFSPETERNRSTYCLELISHVPLRPRTRNRFVFFFLSGCAILIRRDFHVGERG